MTRSPNGSERPRKTLGDFCNSADLAKSLGFRTDPEFTDIDPPLYDAWKAKASSIFTA